MSYGTAKTIDGRPLPEPGPSRKALVTERKERIEADKRHWEPDFKRIREDMDFAYGLQWEGQTSLELEDRYVANIVQRHINQRTSALYAKNPKVVAHRRARLDFSIWDENPSVIQEMMAMASTEMPVPPDMGMMAADIAQGLEARKMLRRVARTLEVMWAHYTDEQVPPFKLMMKDRVRTALVTGVSYVELDFQRTQGFSEERMTVLADARARLSQIERLSAELDMPEGEGMSDTSAEMEQLRLQIQDLQANPDLAMREGLVYDFPDTLSIIPSRFTKMLRGWYGTDWVTKEMQVPCHRIKEWFGIDIGSRYSKPDNSGSGETSNSFTASGKKEDERVTLWKHYDKRDGLIYWMVDGYDDFLREPESPAVNIERFFPFYVLTFNDITHHKRIFPTSDVRILRSMQKEYNRKKEALRQHRIANRPVYLTPAGTLEDDDLNKLVCDHPDHAILPLRGLKEGQAAETAIQPMKKAPIDPNLYETESDFADVLRVVGSQEANIGGTSGDTATEVSVAEGSRLSSIGSNEDDLEMLLNELARDGGNVMLMNLSEETVKEIAGPGAVWPQMSPDTIKQEMFLMVEAGTAGRPNKAMEQANFQRLAPILMQMPSLDPDKLAEYAIRIMDDKVDLADFVKPGTPSIQMMNSAKPAAGPEGTPPSSSEPSAQGSQGAANQSAPAEPPGVSQPAYPSGTEPGLSQGNVMG
jgi:hypothetical protein